MTTKTQFGDYLRNRPFLLVYETIRPAPGVRTEVKGWMKEGAQVLERVSVVDRVQNKHLREASVVIDLLNDVLVKNNARELGDDEVFLDHYKGKYASQIAEGIRIWENRVGLNEVKT